MRKSKILSTFLLSVLSVTSISSAFAVGTFNMKIPNPIIVGRDSDGDGKPDFTPPPLPKSDKISCGKTHCYAIVGGEVYAVGDNTQGQLGDGTNTKKSNWVKSGNLTNVTEVEAGGSHGHAISNGEVYAVGYNAGGQLGDGTTVDKSSWIKSGISLAP